MRVLTPSHMPAQRPTGSTKLTSSELTPKCGYGSKPRPSSEQETSERMDTRGEPGRVDSPNFEEVKLLVLQLLTHDEELRLVDTWCDSDPWPLLQLRFKTVQFGKTRFSPAFLKRG